MELSMYAFFTDILRQSGADKAVEFAKECGFRSIEILEMVKEGEKPLFSSLEQSMLLRHALDKNGMRCSCYSVGINLLADDLGEEKNLSAVDILKQCANHANVLGSPYFHHTLTIGYKPPKDTADPFGDILPSLLERASCVASHCSAMGLTTLYEPQGPYVNGIAGFSRFYDEMKRKSYDVGVCGDLGNTLFLNCSPVDFVRRFASEIQHVHLKDYIHETASCNRQNEPARQWHKAKNGGYLTPTLLGDGIVDIEACIRELHAASYRGAYSLETFYWDLESVPLKENLRKEQTYLSGINSTSKKDGHLL